MVKLMQVVSHPIEDEHFIRLPELSAGLLSGSVIKTKFMTCLTHLLSGQALEHSAVARF
jgi:hypothetical protein